ncbi:IclR family transcriptional regulator [Azospirillum sp.]|uniref:IclR family transcriptional regulator n=1 Tax=Azospirillum sp. TaxID=34012 RepID=UPI00260D5461|nr:IclR family transcriptional regulator [Azospirillum sp.]
MTVKALPNPAKRRAYPSSVDAKYTVDAVDKAMVVLMTVAREPDLGLSEIARRSGELKARTFRLLRTLEARGMVVCRESDRTYRLGYNALALGGLARRQVELFQRARPVLMRLGRDVVETIQLRVRDGDQTMCIASWEPARDTKVRAQIGCHRPIHAGSGKLFLAHCDEDFQDRILSLPLLRLTERTTVDPDDLRRQLATINRQGYAITQGEVETGYVSICAPVFGADGQMVAAINVASPQDRMASDEVARIVPLVKAAARTLSTALGWRMGGGDRARPESIGPNPVCRPPVKP